jgi:uncharacterized membrane protein HdeD (DUF308 family)
MIPTTPGTTGMPPRPWLLTMVLGVALFLLGLFIAVRPLFENRTFTEARWLDMAFAAVFMLRGALNVRTALRRRQSALAQG